jgi:ATP-dependent HslUV protease subunit HslV
MHGTTILCVKKDGKICMIGDGQVSLGPMVVKGNAKKVRRLRPTVLTGFAGSTADAFTLLERLDGKVDEFPNQGITRPCVELAKAWRSDKYLRRLEAVLLVADDKGSMYELTGNGDVLEATGGVMGVGSGGSYALAAARALMKVHGADESNCKDKAGLKTEDDKKGTINMSAEEIARMAMEIASDMCVYTNRNYTVEIIDINEGGAAPATDGEKK